MGKTKISDIAKLAELRGSGKSLREIGEYFNVSPEAVRLALQNIEKKRDQEKQLAQLLVLSTELQTDKDMPPSKNVSQVIDDWIVILQAAKKAALVEDELKTLNERVTQLENRVNQITKETFQNPNRQQTTRIDSPHDT